MVIINRSPIGHAFLMHSFLMSNGEPPLCETCAVKLTVTRTVCRELKKKNAGNFRTSLPGIGIRSSKSVIV